MGKAALPSEVASFTSRFVDMPRSIVDVGLVAERGAWWKAPRVWETGGSEKAAVQRRVVDRDQCAGVCVQLREWSHVDFNSENLCFRAVCSLEKLK